MAGLMLHSVLSRLRGRPRCLTIPLSFPPKGHQIDDVGDREDTARQVLVSVLGQAMHDGMTGVRFGVDANTHDGTLRYYRSPPGGQQQYWDMSPPPFEVFPALFQLVVTMAELSDSVPIEGVIRAIRGRQPVRLRLLIPAGDAIDLSWEI